MSPVRPRSPAPKSCLICGKISTTGFECASAGGHHEARYPSGKGEVCKTFMRRFDPDPRLQFFNNLRRFHNNRKVHCGDFCGDSVHLSLMSLSIELAPDGPRIHLSAAAH